MEIITPTKTLKTYESNKWRILELMNTSVIREPHDHSIPIWNHVCLTIISAKKCWRLFEVNIIYGLFLGSLRDVLFLLEIRVRWTPDLRRVRVHIHAKISNKFMSICPPRNFAEDMCHFKSHQNKIFEDSRA